MATVLGRMHGIETELETGLANETRMGRARQRESMTGNLTEERARRRAGESDSVLAEPGRRLWNAGDIAQEAPERVSESRLGSLQEELVMLRGSRRGGSMLVWGTLREAAKGLSTVLAMQSHGSRSTSASSTNKACGSGDCRASFASRQHAGSRVLPQPDSGRLPLHRR